MVFGAQKNSGMATLKNALRDEGAVSEQMRLKHIKEEHDKVERMRAKDSLTDKKRIEDQEKLELSHRETEIRRLTAEMLRAEQLVKEMERNISDFDSNIKQLSVRFKQMEGQVEKQRKEINIQHDAAHRIQVNAERAEDLRKKDRESAEHEIKTEFDAEKQIVAKNKIEIAHKEADVRMLEAEVKRDTDSVQALDRDIARLEAQLTELKSKRKFAVSELDIKKLKTERRKEEMEKLIRENDTHESEMRSLETKSKRLGEVHEKEQVTKSINVSKMEMEIRRLEADMLRIKTELSHAQNNRMYKERELEARKRVLQILITKKQHELNEIQRLHASISRNEVEIHRLEQVAKPR